MNAATGKMLDFRKCIFNGKAWPHVVFANGRIYARDISGAVKCFEV